MVTLAWTAALCLALSVDRFCNPLLFFLNIAIYILPSVCDCMRVDVKIHTRHTRIVFVFLVKDAVVNVEHTIQVFMKLKGQQQDLLVVGAVVGCLTYLDLTSLVIDLMNNILQTKMYLGN